MPRTDSLRDAQKQIDKQNMQIVTIQLEKRLKLESKRKREHNAVITDIPKEEIAELEGLNRNNILFKNKIRGRLCCCCNQLATKTVSYDYHGARLIEKYCEQHIKKFGP